MRPAKTTAKVWGGRDGQRLARATPPPATTTTTTTTAAAAATTTPHKIMFAHIVSTASLLSLASAAELDAGFNIPTQPSIPANCISWNDGCNTCSVVNGVIGGCTMMMCRQQGTPFCVAYYYSAAPTAVVAKPTPPAAVADVAQTSFCEDSRPQLCRMMCQPPSCPMGQCAMRTDSCCEFTCQAPNPAGTTSSGIDAHHPRWLRQLARRLQHVHGAEWPGYRLHHDDVLRAGNAALPRVRSRPPPLDHGCVPSAFGRELIA